MSNAPDQGSRRHAADLPETPEPADATPPGIAISGAGSLVGQINAPGGRFGFFGGDNRGKVYFGDVYQTLPPAERQSRERMLARVRAHWVQRPLTQLLHGAPLLALDMTYQPDATQQPAKPEQPSGRLGRLVDDDATATGPLPPEATIADVFDAQDGELLILGAPGSGKTTALLSLADELIDRAEKDEQLPMPVIFQLASWTAKHGSFSDWLLHELTQPGGYDVHRQIATSWLAEGRILPLLDGLDEVEEGSRAACVEAINAFQEHRLRATDLVVSSRDAEYQALRPTRLDLRGAIMLQPLRPVQIVAYLAGDGDRLAGLRAALEGDAALRQMATSPLLLSIMVPVYEDAPGTAIPADGTPQERHDQLFASYVNAMFARQGDDPRYSREQTIHWLSWLASSLSRQNQSVFYLERLQPEWLATPGDRLRYDLVDRLGVGLLAGVPLGIACGMFGGLAGGWDLAVQGTVAFGATGGLVGSLLGGSPPSSSLHGPWPAIRGAVLACVAIGAAGGLIGGVAGALRHGVSGGLGLGVAAAVVGGLFGVVAGGLAGGPSLRPRYVNVVETLRWSVARAARAALAGLGLGAVFGLLFALLGTSVGVVQAASRMTAVLLSLLLFGLVFGLGFGLVGGFTAGQVEPEKRVLPNEGIRRSARRAGLVGAGIGLLSAIAFGLLLYGVEGEAVFGARAGVLCGAVLGLLALLAFGGYACLSHAALRFILWRRGAMPLRYVRFLNYAAGCNFIYHVGGGYRFVHALWEQYFAVGGATVTPPADGRSAAPLPTQPVAIER